MKQLSIKPYVQRDLFPASSDPSVSRSISVYRVSLVKDESVSFGNVRLANSQEAQALIKNLVLTKGQPDREQFVVALLSTKNEMIGLNIVSVGGLSTAPVHPREVLKPAILCERANVRYFRYHAMRHLTASILDEMGIPIGTIQRILGHQNRKTTEIYLHSIGDAERKAMNKLQEVDGFSRIDATLLDKSVNMSRSFWKRKVKRPSLEILMSEINNLGFSAVGRKYGVSDNAVRKWMKGYKG